MRCKNRHTVFLTQEEILAYAKGEYNNPGIDSAEVIACDEMTVGVLKRLLQAAHILKYVISFVYNLKRPHARVAEFIVTTQNWPQNLQYDFIEVVRLTLPGVHVLAQPEKGGAQ